MARKIRVLVIDDSASVRQMMTQILSADPQIEVIAAASDPFAAARHMKDDLPDVITLDVEMPRMDGVTFLRKLMSQCPLPVVMCSSLVEDGSETLMQALEAGAVDIILKPRAGVADFLAEQPGVTRVWYPMRADHKQQDLAKKQMTAGGTVVTFEVAGG